MRFKLGKLLKKKEINIRREWEQSDGVYWEIEAMHWKSLIIHDSSRDCAFPRNHFVNYWNSSGKSTLQQWTRRSHSLNTTEQLGTALRFYTCFFLTCGASQSSCCRVIHDLTSAICERKRRFMRFPISIDECRAVMAGFHTAAGFPGVIGDIDGCHVRIVNPVWTNAVRFMNRKDSRLNGQLVCNRETVFTNVVHSPRLLRFSSDQISFRQIFETVSSDRQL